MRFGKRAPCIAQVCQTRVDLPLIDEQERRNGADTVLRRERLLFVNVDFADLDLAVVFIGQFIQQRRDHLAWAAPFRPKIHHDRLLTLHDFAVKIRLVDLDGS